MKNTAATAHPPGKGGPEGRNSFRSLAPPLLLLIGLAALCAGLLTVALTVQAQGQEVTPTQAATGATPPAQPTSLQATAEHDSVALTWTASTDQTVTHYAVLRRNRDTDAVGVFQVIESNAGAETSYEDTTVAAESKYNYRVKAVSPTGVSQWSGFVKADTPAAPDPTPTPTQTPTPTPEPESTPVDLAPSNLTAALAEGGGVTLSWTAPAEDADSVTGYEILRAVGQGEFATLVADTESTATTHTDATATEAGEAYVYQVKAIRGEDRSQASGQAEVQLPHDPADLRPTGVTVSLAENQVTLSWTAPQEDADSVTGYEILRRRPNRSESTLTTLVADTESTATTYTDATATEASVVYVYRVKALRGSQASRWSNFGRIELAADYVPDQAPTPTPEPEATPVDQAPTGLTAALVEGGGVALTWAAPAENADSVTGYEILRAAGEGELTTLLADTGSTATTYTDGTATTAGETYAYQVKAIRDADRSQASGRAQVQIPHDPVDLAPNGLTALILTASVVGEEDSTLQVGLTWSAPAADADGVTGYEILCAVGQGDLTTLVADTESTATSFTDATATEAGETYAYQVKAIRGEDRSQASGQAQVQLPHDPVDLGPSGIVASLAQDGGLTLSWTAPAEEADSVTGYEIVRAVGEDEPATLAADTGSTATSYTDATAAEAGETYAYQIKAIRDGVRSEASAQAAFAVPEASVSTCEFDAEGSDLPADTSTACVLEVDGSVRGERGSADDVDWVRVGLQAGATYQIDMRGKSTGEWQLVDGVPAFVSVGSLEDPRLLGIYDGSGALVPGTDSEVAGTGKDSRIAAFSPDAAGVYYIAASAESGWMGTYVLSLSVTAGVHVTGPTLLEPLSTPETMLEIEGVGTGPTKDENEEAFLKSELRKGVDPPGNIAVKALVGTPFVLVKNTGQTASGIAVTPDSTVPKLAQAFTTGGDSRGYTLSSIGIWFYLIADTSTAGTRLTVTLNANSSGNPGSVLCTLSDPTSFSSNAVNTFDAPTTGTNQCPTLATSTTYFVVVEEVVAGGTVLSWSITIANDEDSGGAKGWSIGNDRYFFENSAWSDSQSPYQIEVNGVVAVPEPVFPGDILVANSGQAVTANAPLNATFTKRAQAFTTGAVASGYSFSSVEIGFSNTGDTTTAGSELTVTLNKASGSDPGDVLCTLADPNSFSASGGHVFTAPPTTDSAPCPALAASTTYLVVIERANVETDTIRLSAVGADDEDSGGAAGWSLADGYRTFSSSWQGSGSALQLAVRGEGINHDATGRPTVTGSGHAGEPLRADVSAIADFNGIDNATFRYQWLQFDDSTMILGEIDGATDPTYTPTTDDVGKTVKVMVRFIDDDGFSEGPLTSAETDKIKPFQFPLVSNTGQAETGHNALSTNTPSVAQGFSTGASADGFYVGSVGIDFTAIASLGTAASELTATINEASGGNPGSVLCTLADPPSYAANSVNYYTAPADCILAASTTYYVVLARANNNTHQIRWAATTATAEDSGGPAGWSIADDRRYFSSGAWSTSTAGIQKIRLRGRSVSNTPAEGAPSIKGLVTIFHGELTAETLGIFDPDGIPADVSFAYEWITFDPSTGIELQPVRRETGETLALKLRHHFSALKVQVSFTDGMGFAESLISARTDRVIGDQPERELLWLGTLGYEDQGSGVFGLQSGSGDLAPNVFEYLMLRYDIPSLYYSTTNEELVLEISPAPDAEEEVVWVLQVDGSEYALSDATSAAVSTPAGTRFTWPVLSAHTANIGFQAGARVRVMLHEVINSPATGVPTYSGGQFVGDTLTADISDIADLNGIPPTTEFSYQWSRGFPSQGRDTDIPGATGQTYELTEDDVGQYIFVTASFRDQKGYPEAKKSVVVVVVKPRDFLVGNAHTYFSNGASEALDSDTPIRAQWFTTGEHPFAYALSHIGIRFREVENLEFGPVSVAVSNTGQTAFGGVFLDSTNIKGAQAFTTGANTYGYALNSIGILLPIANTSTAASHLTATLNEDDNGDPGDALCTLSDPTSFTNGMNTFDAPTTCPQLAPSTTYFVVIERVLSTSDLIGLTTTSTSSEDTGGAVGWSIGGVGHYLQSGNPWATTIFQPYMIEVSTAERQTVADNLTASIVPVGGGLPNLGSTHCTLTSPPNLRSHRVNYFDASDCPALHPNTDYFVALGRTDHSGGTIAWDRNNPEALDPGSSENWSIDGRHFFCTECNGRWFIQSPSSLMITVRGRGGGAQRDRPAGDPRQGLLRRNTERGHLGHRRSRRAARGLDIRIPVDPGRRRHRDRDRRRDQADLPDHGRRRGAGPQGPGQLRRRPQFPHQRREHPQGNSRRVQSRDHLPGQQCPARDRFRPSGDGRQYRL